MPIIDPNMFDLNKDHLPLTKLPSQMFTLFSSTENGFRFPRVGSSLGTESLDDRIAKAQFVAALKQSLRSTFAAKDLVTQQLDEARGPDGEYGVSEAALVLLQVYGYLNSNITNLETLLSACGVDE